MKRRRPKEEDSVPLILEGSHLTDEALELYHKNQLDNEQELSIIEEHLLYCPHCQDRLEKTQVFADGMRAAAKKLEEESSSGKGGSQNPKRLFVAVIAASIAFVFAAPGLWRMMAPPQQVELSSYRSTDRGTAQAGRKIELRLNLEGLEQKTGLRVQVVGGEGQKIFEGNLQGQSVQLPALQKGFHWVRLLAPGTGAPETGELLREFTLEVR
jgi:hypothetical protein